jgi:hypothetical protein
MKKYFKSWSYDANPEKEEIILHVQDVEKGWVSVATLSECPTKNMTDEEIEKTRKEYE